MKAGVIAATFSPVKAEELSASAKWRLGVPMVTYYAGPGFHGSGARRFVRLTISGS